MMTTRLLTFLFLGAVTLTALAPATSQTRQDPKAKASGAGTAAKSASAAPPALPANVPAYLKANCVGCHNRENALGGLDLTALTWDANDPKAFARWVTVHDRVRDGEMPPKSMPRPEGKSTSAFLNGLAKPLIASDLDRTRREGRAVWRRMNRYEYENTLRDLLSAPWLQVRDLLPEDGEAHHFNKVGDALDVSHVQMNRYLSAAEYALREAMAQGTEAPKFPTTRYYARDMRSFAGKVEFNTFNTASERATFPILGYECDRAVFDKTVPMFAGDANPERRELESMGVVASAYEPLEPRFDKFRAPVAGRYKLRLNAHSFWAGPESEKRWWKPSRNDISKGRTREPISLYSERPPGLLRKLGTVEIGPEAGVVEMEVYLLKGESVRPDPVRFFRSRPPGWRNPLATKEGQPGVAYRWLEVEGPTTYRDANPAWPGAGHRLLFGDLPLTAGEGGKVRVTSPNPDGDALRLLRGFVARAYRRPTTEADVLPFHKLFQKATASGLDFTDALILSYSAVLCSPSFVTLEEKPGLLSDWALASRLSYFLTNSEPDAELRGLALQGKLKNPAVLRAQAERLLASPQAERFVSAFLDYWLDLRKANDTSPNEVVYADYYLDDYLRESSVDETNAFFTELVRRNLPARNIVQSDFVTVNERLANHYGIAGVTGVEIRRVALPADSVRGGLLTQASVLKVTANGTNTSPVLRGVWISERILGQTIPPPPASVPAVEPDIRGAVTIREQLEKHRADPSCASCHVKIDPAGFALENFDVFGGFRERYRGLGAAERVPGIGKNGQPFEFYNAAKVDPSGVLPDGRAFSDIRSLKRLLAANERQLARNLVCQLVVYGTGAPVRFGDRPKVEAILDQAATEKYGVRSLILAVIESDLFRWK